MTNLLGLLFFVWLPILLAIYFFKSKPVKHNVPSLFLWRQVFHKRQKLSFFEKFRDNLIFWLQLLFFILLFLGLSQPYFQWSQNRSKRIVIIDNSGSQTARSGVIYRRLDRSLDLARKYLSGVDRKDAHFYTWNNELESLEYDGNVESILSRIPISHLPDGNFVVLLNSIRAFIEQGFRVAFFTDALNFNEQSVLESMDVELFFSAQENRNIFFESISHGIQTDGEMRLRLIVGCTSRGGSVKVSVSNGKTILLQQKIKLGQDDRRELKFMLKVPNDLEFLELSLLPEELDSLEEDNKITYFLNQNKTRVSFTSFSKKSSSLDFLMNFFEQDSRFEINSENPEIEFISVGQLPSNPKAFQVYVMEPDSNKFDNYNARSQVVESEHPLMQFIDGSTLLAASSNIPSDDLNSWQALIQIRLGSSQKSVPGLLIHRNISACLIVNLELNDRYSGNFDYPILLENISRSMIGTKHARSLIEVGDAFKTASASGVGVVGTSNASNTQSIRLQGVYQNASGYSYFARFPVRESRLKTSKRPSSLDYSSNFSDGFLDPSKSLSNDFHDSILSEIIIFLALIVMTVEWYFFSKRA